MTTRARGLDPLRRLEARIEEGLLGDDHPVGGVGDQVLDLLGRGGVVDREAGGAEVHRGSVGELKGGPIDEHEADRVAAADPERREPGRARSHRSRVLGEARLEIAVLEAQRRLSARSAAVI